MKSALNQAENQLASLKTKCNEAEVKSNHQSQELNELQSLMSEKTNAVENLEASMKDKSLEIEKLQSALEEAKLKERNFLTTIEENVKTISLMEDERTDLNVKLESKDEMLERLNTQCNELEDTVKSMTEAVEVANKEKAAAEESICKLQSLWETEKAETEEKVNLQIFNLCLSV